MRNRGFTLIEISIVLVIIALVAGGVMVGRELITLAELRKVVTIKDQLLVSINIFHGKFNALPGDMRNATAYWGVAAGSGSDATCQNASVTTGTCNGNGDGILPCQGGADQCGEYPRVMQQLAYAGLIEADRYTGQRSQNFNVWYERGIRKSFYQYRSFPPYYTIASPGTLGFMVFAMNELRNGYEGFLTPVEAAAIDGKLDDGDADRGAVLGINLGTTTCTAGSTATTDGTANYLVSDTIRGCSMMFMK